MRIEKTAQQLCAALHASATQPGARVASQRCPILRAGTCNVSQVC